ncbi:MAG: prepilin-type N-terminal cleavage/methylation domain-containing protein [Aphanocapsa sp. GSE-SYN-MK-11-07L]|jgi:type IV pilus assembly protein PilA|nr:prepilin-type N-terminal cleavage/methylation domain-containing protein [Aphanocapsa sp. GSE-SYN-MK-11-07L]
MKTELRAKFLQHLLSKKKNNEGFTLIELLVVVIIIGILAAIALPSMLNQANKARESGAQSQVGAVNRAQQAYRLENTRFASTITELQVNLPAVSDGYTYTVTNGTATLGRYEAFATVAAERRSFSGCVTATGGLTNATILASTLTAAPPACTP